MDIKVGDKLKVVIDMPEHANVMKGDIVTVSYVNPDGRFGYKNNANNMQWSASAGFVNKNFELIQDKKMPFKEGDKVRYTDTDSTYNPTVPRNKVLVVVGYNPDSDIVSTNKGSAYSSRFSLVESNALEELIEIANKGYKAINEIRDNPEYRKQVQRLRDDFWEEIPIINNGFKEMRLKPKSTNFSWIGYDCTIKDDDVKIGCQKFDKAELVRVLAATIKGLVIPNKINSVSIAASRSGVFFGSNLISWEDLEILNRILTTEASA